MEDQDKTREQLMEEMVEMRRRVAELETSETERKQAEEQIAEIQRHLVNAQKVARIGSWTFNLANLEVKWSEEMFRLFGVDPTKGALSWPDGHEPYFHPDDWGWAKETIETAISEGREYDIEPRFFRPDGSVGYLHTRAEIFLDENGKPEKLVGTSQDTTAYRRVEEAIRESEERYRNIVELAPDSILTADASGIITSCNRAFVEQTGFGHEDIVGKHFTELPTHPNSEDTSVYSKLFASTVAGEKAESFEFLWSRKDGTLRWGDVRAAVVTADGEFQGAQVIMRDITERKQAEEALRESEERFHIASRIASDVVYERDLQTGIATFYSDIDSHLGYEPGEYPRTMEDWREHVHPEDLAWIDRRSIYQLEPDVPHSIEYRMRKKDGTYMTWWDRVMLIRDEKTGKPIKFIGAATDITERKQAEEALRESEEKLRLMFESVTEGITITDLNGNVVDTNEATARMHGCYSKEKLIGQSAFALIAERDQTRAIENLKRTLEEGYIGALEYTLLREDGSEFPGELNAALIRDMSGSPIGFVAITTDITERKQAEAALRESEEKLRRMFESVSDGIAVTDLDGVITDVNRRTVEMLGYATEDDLVGRNTFDLVAPVDGERAAANMQRTLQEGRAEGLEYTLVKADGSVFPGNMGTSVLRNASGEPAGFIAVTRDITERKQVEEEVRKSEERLKVTLDSIQAGVVIIDEETRAIVDVNPYAAGMFGASNEKIIGHVCHKFICPAEVGKCPIIDLGQSADNSERVLVNINGESIPVLKTVSRIMLGGRNCLLESFVDLSDRKEMEEERRRIENLESIGTLAGGIAHDFNNILTGIMGNISLARRYAKPESKVEERLLEAEKASLRAKDLTRQLLTFARGVAPIKKLVSIAELIEDSTTFALRGSNVRCEFSFQYDLRSVEIDEGQINQVITNLVLNAGEAMPGGGIVNIGVKNRVITTRSALPLPEGNYLEITIADHGVGISKENLRKLFDPYFTTKPKGSGLGLSTAYSIIKNHGGRITVNSRLEVGTTFHIYLPASEKPVPVKKEAAAETTVASKGRILVMDDEEAIRELLHNELTGIGYEVELTVDGTQAIEQYTQARESGQPFDAVILDLTVPGGVGGKEVIEKLLEIDPGVKAIVTSGYSTNPIMSAFREYGFSAAVAKPYSTGELEKILRSITGNGE